MLRALVRKHLGSHSDALATFLPEDDEHEEEGLTGREGGTDVPDDDGLTNGRGGAEGSEEDESVDGCSVVASV